ARISGRAFDTSSRLRFSYTRDVTRVNGKARNREKLRPLHRLRQQPTVGICGVGEILLTNDRQHALQQRYRRPAFDREAVERAVPGDSAVIVGHAAQIDYL